MPGKTIALMLGLVFFAAMAARALGRGEIMLRGGRMARRDTDPGEYWTYTGLLGLAVVICALALAGTFTR